MVDNLKLEEKKSNRLVSDLYMLSTKILFLDKHPKKLRMYEELLYTSLSALYGCEKCYRYHFLKAFESNATLSQLKTATYLFSKSFPQETFEQYGKLYRRLNKTK